MNVFEAVKQTVTTRQAAELYGIRVNRYGMAVCPFHNDRNPSMKVDKRFHCFACQADGDAIDFVSRLFGLSSKEAAMKLADDFGICYDSRQLVDIQAKLQAGKGAGYVRWAKVFNLKQMAQTMNYLTEHNLLEYAVLEEKAAAATAHHNELSAKIKAAEKRMAEIAVLRTHIINYAKTRDTYALPKTWRKSQE